MAGLEEQNKITSQEKQDTRKDGCQGQLQGKANAKLGIINPINNIVFYNVATSLTC